MIIILEGPDGAGKTFTAEYLSSQLGIKQHHFGGPPKSKNEMVSRLDMLFQKGDWIFDRCPLISEEVYGPILRDGSAIPPAIQVFYLNRLALSDHIIIFCYPSFETTCQIDVLEKDHKPKDHCEGVERKRKLIYHRYDIVMAEAHKFGLDIFLYNRDTTTLEELCAALTSVLEGIKSMK